MRSFNEITILPGKKTAVLGTANTWYDVYKALEAQNLTAVGARSGGVGVGGYILAGRISSLSNLHGCACANVQTYQVVGAYGGILDTVAKYPDVFSALCCGGNIFGVVTTFTVNLYPQGPLWHSIRKFGMDKKHALLKAYVNIGRNMDKDPSSSSSFTSFAVTGEYERITVGLENVDGLSYPPIFGDMKAIPALFETSNVQYMSEITKKSAAQAPSGSRYTKWTYTFKLDATLAEFAVDTFLKAVRPLKHILGIKASCTFETISKPMLKHMDKNAFGLSAENGPYSLLLLSATWTNKADDVTFYNVFSSIIEMIRAEAKKSHLHVGYLYMNYASQFQDVFSSYGPENIELLRATSQHYDPKHHLERLQPGYFKINGSAPAKLVRIVASWCPSQISMSRVVTIFCELLSLVIFNVKQISSLS
ncbi:hypothetical protein AJ79_07596 [Helicocarpus griseus UAMH5409]|uniref:FAD-binding PCMH-type domain-containing protein n=1 Tax=Helicocarpus griseus UAMH5409 TaxID=1447875 RepID=A0A2B7X1H3_9EURO|nr:hypothetical protein AJ79_07596 [Helicocarpus griseus UAMH5409]